MIREVQDFWNNLEKEKLKTVAEYFGLSLPSVRKYVQMTEDEIESMEKLKSCKKRKDSTMEEAYRNPEISADMQSQGF